ncbi:hypothetical protein SORBI_3004G128666 [Sorghum bicolor]|uniref:Uncharacterized protein n=1 Tax=Sorghum bicolor TaxID=4558 RepID=A0A1Z5RM71_SORBI|nr:hypothetical protein SORBI_3004G128666 [Sorghum bicolor]
MATISAALTISFPPPARVAMATTPSASSRIKVQVHNPFPQPPSSTPFPSSSLVQQFCGVIQLSSLHLRAESRALQVLCGVIFLGAGDLRCPSRPAVGETRKIAPFVSAGHFHEHLDCGCHWAVIPRDCLPHLPQAHRL